MGVNEFISSRESHPEIMTIDTKMEAVQKQKIAALRKKRDNVKVQTNLDKLAAASKTDTNLLPVILDCVESYATLGEIADVMRGVFGEYQAG